MQIPETSAHKFWWKQAWGGAHQSVPWTTATKPKPHFEKALGSELKKHSMLIINLIFHFCAMQWFYGRFGDHRKRSQDKKTASEKCNSACAKIISVWLCSIWCQPKSPTDQGDARWRVPGPHIGTGITERRHSSLGENLTVLGMIKLPKNH